MKAPRRGRMPLAERVFRAALEQAGLPAPFVEYRFAPPRKWRFDYAFPYPAMVALEVEGGAWTNGRHTRGSGFVRDMEKYNEAALQGWTVLRVTPKELPTRATMALIRRALKVGAS